MHPCNQVPGGAYLYSSLTMIFMMFFSLQLYTILGLYLLMITREIFDMEFVINYSLFYGLYQGIKPVSVGIVLLKSGAFLSLGTGWC